MAFDGGFNIWIGAENFSSRAKGLARVGADVGFIQIEVSVFDLLFENFISGTIGVGRLGTDGAGDGDAHAGIGGAAGTGSGNGVGRGVSGSDFGGAFGRNWTDFRRDSDLRGVGGGPGKSCRFALVDAGGIA